MSHTTLPDFIANPAQSTTSFTPNSSTFWNEIPLGVDGRGTVSWNIDNVQNVFVSGSTGTGKTILQNTALNHLLQHSDHWKFYGFSFKPFEFELGTYEGTDIYGGVSDTVDSAVMLMAEIMDELEARWDYLKKTGASHVDELPDPLKSIMIVVDNFFCDPSYGDSDERDRQELLRDLSGIFREGKNLGVHMFVNMLEFKGSIYQEYVTSADMRILLGDAPDEEKQLLFETDECLGVDDVRGRGIIWERGHMRKFQGYYTPYPWEQDL